MLHGDVSLTAFFFWWTFLGTAIQSVGNRRGKTWKSDTPLGQYPLELSKRTSLKQNLFFHSHFRIVVFWAGGGDEK